MAGLFGSAASTSQANTLGDLSKDVALQTPPDDSISDLAFSPQSDHLAVASWDKKVRIYQITQNGGSEGKAFFEHDAPVLSCHWSPVRLPPPKITDGVLTVCRMAQRS
jgi:mRNA export factor